MSESENAVSKEVLDALASLMKKIEKRPRLVGALTDPQTSNEAFYSILFGEVEGMLDKVASIEKGLIRAETNLSGRLNLQVSQLLAASEKTEKLMVAVADTGKKQIIDQLNSSKAEFTAEMMKASKAAAIEAAKVAIVGEVEKALGKMEETANAGAGKLSAAGARLDLANKEFKTSFLKMLGGAVLIAVVVGAVTVAGSRYIAPAHDLTPVQARSIYNGELLELAYPKLDTKAQAVIANAGKQKGPFSPQ